MKCQLLAILFLLFSCTVLAQDQLRMPKNKPVRKKKQVYELVDNVVKLNISSLLFRTFSLQFEKKINRSKTFALGVVYRPNFPTPFVQDLLNDTSFTASAETRNLLESSRFSTWMITPEFRFYFKKKAPRGLYLAPFLRFKHRTYSSEFQYQESSIGSSLKTGIYKNQANIVGAGILFGLQILAKNKMTIDFWFLGPWAGVKFSKNSSKINAGALNEYDKAYIESVTEGYNRLFGFANSYQWNKSGFGNSGTQFGAGLRLCGINFGYSF